MRRLRRVIFLSRRDRRKLSPRLINIRVNRGINVWINLRHVLHHYTRGASVGWKDGRSIVRIGSSSTDKMWPVIGAWARGFQAEASAMTTDAAVAADNDRLIPFARVQDMVGLKRTRIYRLIRESGFPAPYKPGGVGSRWSEAEVRAWIEGIKETRAA
jgi:prophage regulatory protein